MAATDLGSPVQLSGETAVVVYVLDANDEPPQFNASVYSFFVEEGPPPLSVGQVQINFLVKHCIFDGFFFQMKNVLRMGTKRLDQFKLLIPKQTQN